ncbi:hypothetical protein [Microbulbifer sp. S227A]|uniref:hypothetical protein n=1 Tax=Microbulbifer sp. S227A TaxID=3415131 RepID=UPI003C7C1524
MTVFFFFAAILLVSIISAIVAAEVAAQPPLLSLLGSFSTGLLGLALCALLATTLLFMLDPDPVTGLDAPLPRLMRTLPIAGLSALLWLPIYLSLFGRLRRARSPR